MDTFDICIEPCFVQDRYIVSSLDEDERFFPLIYSFAMQTNSMCEYRLVVNSFRSGDLLAVVYVRADFLIHTIFG